MNVIFSKINITWWNSKFPTHLWTLIYSLKSYSTKLNCQNGFWLSLAASAHQVIIHIFEFYQIWHFVKLLFLLRIPIESSNSILTSLNKLLWSKWEKLKRAQQNECKQAHRRSREKKQIKKHDRTIKNAHKKWEHIRTCYDFLLQCILATSAYCIKSPFHKSMANLSFSRGFLFT